MGNVASGSGEVFQPLEEDDPATVAGYRLSARLGSGGMGKVYLSYTPGGRAVAIKVIRPEFAEDPEFRRRFRQEVLAAQRVQGLYTAPVIAADTDGPRPWLATAYVPGPTLAAAVAGLGPLEPQTVLLLIAGIAEALQSIHGVGIVHRDLKPSNVLLAADGPRVIDFGIARAADATALTGSGAVVGTPAFMAPEQAVGGRVAPATDVFALGQVAVFAALGTTAYGEGPSHGVLYRIVHDEPDLSALPSALMPVVSRCLVKDPAARPSLSEIIGLCQAAMDQAELRRPESWLPTPIAATIVEHQAAPAPPPSPVPTEASVPSAPLTAQAPTQTGLRPAPPPPPLVGPPPAFQPATAPRSLPHAVPTPYPVMPQTMGHAYTPYPAPRQPRGRRTTVTAISVIGASLMLFAGCTALVHSVNDTRVGADGGTKASGKARASSSPTPATFPSVHLPDGYHLEFADDPLVPKYNNYDDLYISCDASGCDFGAYNTKLVLLDRTEKGSLSTCLRDTRFTEQIPGRSLSTGSQICAQTPSGDVALVTYEGASPTSDPSRYATLNVTVWHHAISTD